MAKPNGYLIYDGPSTLTSEPIIAIATNLSRKSLNSKTGNMVQTWILNRQANPLESVASGDDVNICGGCPQRGDRKTRTCYVQLEHAPLSVWRAYQRGHYQPMPAGGLAGRTVRLGAYGDPAAVPYDVWEGVLEGVTRWTGYTHQWRTCDQRFSSLLMASCDVSWEIPKAYARGWRVFFARTMHDTTIIPDNMISCPASDEAGHRTTCERCVLCNGAREGDRRKSIVIEMHGINGASHDKQRAMLNRKALP